MHDPQTCKCVQTVSVIVIIYSCQGFNTSKNLQTDVMLFAACLHLSLSLSSVMPA